MKYCKTCKIKVDAPLESCLICSDVLETIDQNPPANDFVEYVEKSNKFEVFFKGLLLLNIMAIVISLSVDFILNRQLSNWSLIVSVSNLYLILFVKLITSHMKFVIRLFWIVLLSILELIAIGYLTNDYYWALDIVMPLSLVFNTILLIIFTFSKRKRWQDYVMFLIISAVASMAAILFPFFDIAKTNWAYIVSFFFGMFTLIGLFIFSPKDMKEEFLRRFHI